MANENLGEPTEPSQESLNRGALHLCSGSWHSETLNKHQFYSASYFNWGALELCFGRAKPTEAPLVAMGLCTWYVKLARYVKLSLHKHDRAQSGVALNVWFTSNRMCVKNNTCQAIQMWRKQAIIEWSRWSDLGEWPLVMLVKLVNSW